MSPLQQDKWKFAACVVQMQELVHEYNFDKKLHNNNFLR